MFHTYKNTANITYFEVLCYQEWLEMTKLKYFDVATLIWTRILESIEDSKRSYSHLEESLLGKEGYKCLGETEIKTRNETESFSNIRTHYNGPGEDLKYVTEANKILDEIH